MFHRPIILVLTDFGTTPAGHNTVEYLIRCHKSNWQAVNWFVKEKWNERLWFFFAMVNILVVYSTINASNWLSLTFSKVQLQKFCNFYTSLDGLMSKTICISKLCAIENKINEDHLEIWRIVLSFKKIRNYSFFKNSVIINILQDFIQVFTLIFLNILAGNSKHCKKQGSHFL